MDRELLFNQIKLYFKNPIDGNSSIYNHLVRLLTHIYTEVPEDPYANFESSSIKIKQTYGDDSYKLPTTKKVPDIELNDDLLLINNLIQQAESYSLISSDISLGYNFFELSKIFELSGVFFNEIELLVIQLATTNLLKMNNVPMVRFWGKLFGIKNDYYILEVQIIDNEDKTSEYRKVVDSENKANESIEYQYYYLTGLNSTQWIKFPNLNQTFLKKVETMKKLIKGEPDSAISCDFPGVEIDYVRSLIEIISKETIIDLVSTGDEDGNSSGERWANDYNNSFNPMNLNSWTYTRSVLPISDNSNSRTDSLDSLEKHQFATETDESNKVLPKTLNESLKSGFISWKISFNCSFNSPISLENRQSCVVRSIFWPGAFAIFYGGKVINCYIGNGIQMCSNLPFPPIPLPIMEDPVEPQEQIEPQPEPEVESDGESFIEV